MTQNAAVDVERILADFLRDQSDLAAVVSTRVYTVMPNTKTFPLVCITLIDEIPVTHPLYLTDSLIQVDCYGTTKTQARQIMDLTRRFIGDDLKADYDNLGVVTGVAFVTASYLPDDAFDKAQPRFQYTVRVFSHPGTALVS